MTKTCKKCLVDKPMDDFHKDKNRHSGHVAICKPCMKIYTAGYRAKNREKRLAKQKEYAKKNPEKIKDLNLRANYGLTYDSYIQMLAEQNGKCKICGRSDSGHVNSKWLAVDHDHATGKIRGLLCQPCNRGIGLLRDCPDTLAAAIIYLKESA